MNEFRYCGYHTEYSCTGSINLRRSVNACFAQARNQLQHHQHNVFHVYLAKGTELSKTNHQSNACLVSATEIKNHLECARKMFNFKFTIEDNTISYDQTVVPAFDVMLEFNDLHPRAQFYILTWLRYLYEYPYNVLLQEVHYLRKDPTLKYINNFSLCNVVFYAMERYTGINSGHCFYPGYGFLGKFVKNQQIKERVLHNQSFNSLCDVSPRGDNFLQYKLPPNSEFSASDLEFWSEERFLADRKAVYMNIIHKLQK